MDASRHGDPWAIIASEFTAVAPDLEYQRVRLPKGKHASKRRTAPGRPLRDANADIANPAKPTPIISNVPGSGTKTTTPPGGVLRALGSPARAIANPLVWWRVFEL